MSRSSILGGERAPQQAKGRSAETLGPGDTSDSGSDIQGERPMATGADAPDEWGAVVVDGRSDSDASGTGERASATGDDGRDGADILPDRIIDPMSEEAGGDDTVDIEALTQDDGLDEEGVEGSGAD